jgi:hypothetical protein
MENEEVPAHDLPSFMEFMENKPIMLLELQFQGKLTLARTPLLQM